MSEVVGAVDYSKPIIRRKALSARNESKLAATVDFGENGVFTFDEPRAHGATDLGPTPLQAGLTAMSARASVTFSRAAKEVNLEYSGIDFDPVFTNDIRGLSDVRAWCRRSSPIKLSPTSRRTRPKRDFERWLKKPKPDAAF